MSDISQPVTHRILVACNSRGRMLDRCLKLDPVRENIWGIISDHSSDSLIIARKYQLNNKIITGTSDELLSDNILKYCIDNEINFLISTGYTRIFRGDILTRYRGRIFNTHFSILPAFPGRRNSDWTTTRYPARSIFERTLEFGSRITGNTVHLIDASIDGGHPVMQSSMVVPYDEDPRHTRHRLFIQECQCLMQLIVWLSADRLFLRDGKWPQIKGGRFNSPNFAPALEDDWIIAFNPEPLAAGTP